NTVLFAGLGVTWVMSSLSGKVGAEIERATLVGFGLSVTVEGLQVFSPVRTASIVDVTTNTLGAFAGAVVVALFLAALHRARGARSYLGVPTLLLTGAYTACSACRSGGRRPPSTRWPWAPAPGGRSVGSHCSRKRFAARHGPLRSSRPTRCCSSCGGGDRSCHRRRSARSPNSSRRPTSCRS